jgi:hypothetical protein
MGEIRKQRIKVWTVNLRMRRHPKVSGKASTLHHDADQCAASDMKINLLTPLNAAASERENAQ